MPQKYIGRWKDIAGIYFMVTSNMPTIFQAYSLEDTEYSRNIKYANGIFTENAWEIIVATGFWYLNFS